MGDVIPFKSKEEEEVVTAILIKAQGRELKDIWNDFFTVTVTMPCCGKQYRISPTSWPKENTPCECGKKDHWVVLYGDDVEFDPDVEFEVEADCALCADHTDTHEITEGEEDA